MNKNNWYDYYNILKEYVLENGHAYVPFNYVAVKDDKNYGLGYWVCMQRAAYNGTGRYNITEEKIKLLNDIGMIWDLQNRMEYYIPDKWMEMYNIAKEYYEKNGNLYVPSDCVIIKNNKKYNLGSWIITQHSTYNGKTKCILTEKQIELLNDIEMVWDRQTKNESYISNKWMEMYNIAKQYYEKNGNLYVPSDYIVNNLKGKEVNLYIWICTQRYYYKSDSNHSLCKKQIDLLNNIGMIWDGYYKDNNHIPKKWMKMYNIAKEYYKEFGNLCVPSNYLVKDSNDEIVNLYNWIWTQRDNYDESSKYHLNKKQIDMLNEIGMIWNIKEYKELWKKYRDIFKKYKKGLIFQSDKEYLKSVGIDITTDRSILIDDKYIIEKANSVVRKKQ